MKRLLLGALAPPQPRRVKLDPKSIPRLIVLLVASVVSSTLLSTPEAVGSFGKRRGNQPAAATATPRRGHRGGKANKQASQHEQKAGLIAAVGDSANIPQRSKRSEETFRRLIVKAEAGERVRVIVGLSATFVPEGHLVSAQSKGRQREGILRAQDAVLGWLSSYDKRSVKKFPFIPYMAVAVDAEDLKRLQALRDVTSIEEDVPMPPLLEESVSLIGAPAPWAAGFTGKGQTVAILDTGVDKTHPFLAGKVVSEACYSTNGEKSVSVCPDMASQSTVPGSGAPCDSSILSCRHGTHVAGIAAGKGEGFSGVAKDASLISIQVFSRYDNQSDCGDPEETPAPCVLAPISDQVLGLHRVQSLTSEYTIAAVNISIGGGRYPSQADCDSEHSCMKAAIDNLRSVGIATVIASGNDGHTDGLASPACISTAVSVGSTDDGGGGTTADTVSDFGGGYASNSASYLNLLAPGQLIYSSVPGGGFEYNRGTSMAAPHVAGAWAVLKSKSPAATVDEVLTALSRTGVTVRDQRNNISKPRIRVDAAFDDLGSPNLPPHPPTSIRQHRIFADEPLLEGGDTRENAVRFRASISDPDGDPVKLQIELRQASEPFRGVPTIESGIAHTTQVTLTQLGLDYGTYKWACRTVDAGGLASSWVEFGATGNADFSRVRAVNDYVRIDHVYRHSEGGTTYIYVRWTLLRKWNEAAVAVYASLNDNLPSTTRSSVFEPLFMGGNFIVYFDSFRSLGVSLDQGFYMWKRVGGGGCNNAGPGPEEYAVGNQYTTRFPAVFDMETFSWVDASQVALDDDIRFTIYDRTHFDGSPCNMDFKEAFPASPTPPSYRTG